MPGRDGTGPMGRGVMDGRGFGVCAGAKAIRGGAGQGQGQGQGQGRGRGRGQGTNCRRGFGRNLVTDLKGLKTEKELLEEQKELLES